MQYIEAVGIDDFIKIFCNHRIYSPYITPPFIFIAHAEAECWYFSAFSPRIYDGIVTRLQIGRASIRGGFTRLFCHPRIYARCVASFSRGRVVLRRGVAILLLALAAEKERYSHGVIALVDNVLFRYEAINSPALRC